MDKMSLTAPFRVGEKVRIVNTPCSCAFGWVHDMNRLCGREVEIREISYLPSRHAWLIHVKGNAWSWDEKCFVRIEQERDIQVSDIDIMTLLS